jgi:glycosyltransferase involved in cell wall biosynthesis
MTRLTYATITPARDEVENLARLGPCLEAQTVRPLEWIVVDDGSTDGSFELVEAFAAEWPWIRAVRSAGVRTHAGPLEAGRRVGRDVIAFNTGVEQLRSKPGVLFKLDADVSFEPDFFERLLDAFDADPRLGIAGGECLELENGEWRLRNVTGGHVRGATRGYRWACFEDVSPLTVQLGWDGIDEVEARLAGWETRSIRGVSFRHHRPVGARDGAWSSYESQGATARFMGYRISYLVARSLFRALRDPRALGMVVGWAKAAREGQPRHDDDAVRSYIRSQQRLTRVPRRALEALGLR